jgi:ketosteroid isomerase-like protein
MGAGLVFTRLSVEFSHRALCSRRLPQVDSASKQERKKHSQARKRQNHVRMLSYPPRAFRSFRASALRQDKKMNVKTPDQDRNEQLIRRLYYLAEAASKDTPKFVSLFADGGYFYDVAGGKKYYGSDIGLTVDAYAAAFPDMHRELGSFYLYDNVVIVELSLNGTHKGDLAMPAGTIPATGKEMHAPCCDVFHIENGKVTSFHCYLAVPILLGQLGVLMNLGSAFRH